MFWKRAKKKDEGAEAKARVLVLGTGCKKCHTLMEHVEAAMSALGQAPDAAHVSDVATIASYGVMQTPALVVDGCLHSQGKILSVEELQSILG